MRKKLAVYLAVTLAVVQGRGMLASAAADFYVNTNAPLTWENDANWSLTHKPAATDDALFDLSNLTLTIGFTGNENSNSLEVGGSGSSFTFDLGGNTLSLTNGLTVGQNGSGNLTLQDGTINAGTLGSYIGFNSGSFGGTFTVTNSGASASTAGKFTSASDVYVGGKNSSAASAGEGTLNVSAGGSVSTTGTGTLDGEIQIGFGGVGHVLVDGSGSSLSSGLDLILGNASGTGNLDVRNNANVSVGGYLYVGVGGSTGNLFATTGATIKSTFDVIDGNLGSSNGTISLDAASLTTSGTLFVGALGSGTLLASNGSTISAVDTIIGANDSSSNTMPTSGSQNSAQSDLGYGTVVIDHSTFTSTDVTVGMGDRAAGGAALSQPGYGSLTLSGGTQAVITGELDIGDLSGNGTVVIDGTHATGSATSLSSGSNSTATINIGIDSADSTFASIGTLSVKNGAVVNVGSINLGVGSLASSGTLSITGGTVSAVGSDKTRGNIQIGLGGTGNAFVSGNGSTLSSGYDLVLGNSGGIGSLTLSNQAQATVGNQLFVGAGFSKGNLTATAGASINVGTTIYAGNLSGIGTISLDASSLTTSTNGTLYVGEFGQGTLAALNGSTVSAANTVIGANDGGTPNPSTPIANTSTGSADFGVGSVLISNSIFKSTNVTVGYGDTTPPDTTLAITRPGIGSLTLTNGTQATVGGDLNIGTFSGDGTVEIDGTHASGAATSLAVGGAINIGSDSADTQNASMGTLLIENGAIVNAGSVSVGIGSISSAGTLSITTDAALITKSLDISHATSFTVPSGHVTINNGLFTLPTGSTTTIGNGTMPASLTLNSATVTDPTRTAKSASLTISSDATITVHGATSSSSNITLSGGATPSTYMTDAGPTPADMDLLTTSGIFTAGGAILDVLPVGSIQTNTPYPIIKSPTNSINYSSADPNTQFSRAVIDMTSRYYGSYNVDVDYSSSEIDVVFTETPEPTSAAIMGAAFGIVSLRRRRKVA